MITRFSSRLEQLHAVFLQDRLKQATSYRRIAGYFTSSIFELVGEELSQIPEVKIVCNSELSIEDISISKLVRETALKERWNRLPLKLESLLHKDRYRKLYELLSRENLEIRVVPKEKVFLHGKAGIITSTERKTCFIGSINETAMAFTKNYEIVWEDDSPEGVAWVEDEFIALWEQSYPLPDAIVDEIKRVSDRFEIRFTDLTQEHDTVSAALAEVPLYRNGEQLQPWQRSFVTRFLEHRDTYGGARLLLADEVGLGKTLSMATSAMVATLLGDGPTLILCPATLTLQWQAELKDKLGIPSAVWLSNKKCWQDAEGKMIRTRGPEDIIHCPFQIAIVSTGLIFQQTPESIILLKNKYGTVILDESHKARMGGGINNAEREPNNLMEFMIEIGFKAKNLVLGTATPIQTNISDLWDQMKILNSGKDFVMGKESTSLWNKIDLVVPLITGAATEDERNRWELLRNPLPPLTESTEIAEIRNGLSLPNTLFYSDTPFSNLNPIERMILQTEVRSDYFTHNNPIIRHTVFRKRQSLEESGLLEKIGVNIHPILTNNLIKPYPKINFSGIGLITNTPFDLAYQAALEFTSLLGERTKAAGFIKSLLLQRICSSFASGRATANRILRKQNLADEELYDKKQLFNDLTQEEQDKLQTIINELSRPEARDPKLEAVMYFLTKHISDNKTWLEHGCIIFSQYFDTVKWLAKALVQVDPSIPVAVYAGANKSGIYYQGNYNTVLREDIKMAVKNREIKLIVATDAACEGLNLQTLGTLINVDLPWNPSRLEQRLGRIKRFGQIRKEVDMLNLVYHDTQDEKIYQTISKRLKDRYNIFGSLPDTIEDDWIESEEKLDAEIEKYIHLRNQAKNAFDLKYEADVNPNQNRWELCSRVLSREDVVEALSKPW
jgi:SNF2 family DNA or RNA helicase